MRGGGYTAAKVWFQGNLPLIFSTLTLLQAYTERTDSYTGIVVLVYWLDREKENKLLCNLLDIAWSWNGSFYLIELHI